MNQNAHIERFLSVRVKMNRGMITVKKFGNAAFPIYH